MDCCASSLIWKNTGNFYTYEWWLTLKVASIYSACCRIVMLILSTNTGCFLIWHYRYFIDQMVVWVRITWNNILVRFQVFLENGSSMIWCYCTTFDVVVLKNTGWFWLHVIWKSCQYLLRVLNSNGLTRASTFECHNALVWECCSFVTSVDHHCPVMAFGLPCCIAPVLWYEKILATFTHMNDC